MNETIEQLRRVLQEMWHRRWIGLAMAWVVALIAITVTFRIPEQFEASARVYVDTDSILQPLLSGLAVHPNVEQQVAALSRTLINRPNVEKVVRSVDLDIRARNDVERGEIVDRVMKSIKMSNAGNNLYFISYYDPNPEQGRRVVQALLTIFMESSLGDKRQDTRAAVRFLDEQIKHYEGTLSAAENRLKEFKLRYMGVTEKDNYFARVAAIGEQIAQAQLELSSAMQSRDAYKKELAGEQPTYLP
ncbi:MAG TPA: XrtA system polysaccharide chain length determinant, partial [Casimicrobiaceae bacterium]|nr:XrtA system polysaccharide chain length determinant [Casimicrobiaceae bacterium]